MLLLTVKYSSMSGDERGNGDNKTSSTDSSSLQSGTGSKYKRFKVDEVEKLLECPVCFDDLLAPIYCCQTGHVICEKCKGKLNECPTCLKPYTDARCFTLESIIQAAVLYCKYRQNGCNFDAPRNEMEAHYNDCQFRPRKCHLDGLDECNGTLLYISECLEHLKTIHKYPTVALTTGEGNSVTFIQTYEAPDWGNIATKRVTFAGSLFEFDKYHFVTAIFNNETLIYSSVLLIGDKDKAAQYAIKIIIPSIPKDKGPKFEVIIPVLSICEFQENKNNYQNLPIASVQKAFLEILGTLSQNPASPPENEKIKFVWNAQYEILKV